MQVLAQLLFLSINTLLWPNTCKHMFCALIQRTRLLLLVITLLCVILSQRSTNPCASDKPSNQTFFTIRYVTQQCTNPYIFCQLLWKTAKHVNMLCHNSQKGFSSVQGSDLYLLAGVVSAESHLGHLHLEVIAPFSSALWEQSIAQESKTEEQIKNQKKCKICKTKPTHFCFDLSWDFKLIQTWCNMPG